MVAENRELKDRVQELEEKCYPLRAGIDKIRRSHSARFSEDSPGHNQHS